MHTMRFLEPFQFCASCVLNVTNCHNVLERIESHENAPTVYDASTSIYDILINKIILQIDCSH